MLTRQSTGASSDAESLRIGVAEIDITPELGIHLGGDACRLRPADRVLDPLYGRVLLAEAGGGERRERVCLLVLDLCVLGAEIGTEIREAVAKRLGVGVESVMLHLLQNHSAPSLGGHMFLKPDSPGASEEFWWTYRGDPRYLDYLKPLIFEAVDKAVAVLRPADICVAGLADARVAHNRRFVMRDGWVQTQATALDGILQVEGPTDPEVGIACFRDETGAIVAALLHHTAHPVSQWGTCRVTASWPGAWARAFKTEFGERCVPLVINGCCGNINKGSPLDRERRWPDDDWIAARLMENVKEAMRNPRWQTVREVGAARRIIRLPFAPLEDVIGRDSLQDAHELMRREPAPRWKDESHTAVDVEWLFALYLVDMDRRLRNRDFACEVQAFRIGPLALPGLMGEPFVEGQLRLKLESPAERTFVAHMCNGVAGYIPPREAYRRKHYLFRTADGRPVRRGANFYLFPDYALDRIVDAGIDLLRGMYGGPTET